MVTSEIYNAKTVGAYVNEAGTNKIPFLGSALFPVAKKMGLDLKWIGTTSGATISLQPSSFDTVSTIRSRQPIDVKATQMAFFKESMIIDENDEQEIMRLQSADDPYANQVITKVYDDAKALVDGAEIVGERMIMQLLSGANGHPGISISGDGATYVYNYDADGKYAANNFKALSGTSKWSDVNNSDPIADVQEALDKVEANTGSRPTKMIVSAQTMTYLKNNAKIRSYVLAQNATANIIMTNERVKEIFSSELGVAVIPYTKTFVENGTVKKLYPDGYAALIPDGALGKLWKGVTPEERRLMQNPVADVAIVNGGTAVTVTVSEDPVQTKTTVSEVCLPSFERMLETFTINVY